MDGAFHGHERTFLSSSGTALFPVHTATFLSSDAAKPRVVHLNRRVVSLSSTLAAES